MKAIILAGGKGERLRPLTNKTPKPLLKIKGKPILEHTIENLKKYHITDIILAVSYHADKIKRYFGDGKKFGVNISYSIEKKPLGTGGAVIQAAEDILKPFLLIWGDNLMDIDIYEMQTIHQHSEAEITMALTPREDVEHFGVAKVDHNKIIGFIEKPTKRRAPSNLINAGAFIIKPEASEILPEGEKSSIEKDCFEILSKKEMIYVYRHHGYWFPTDDLEKYKKAEEEFK